MMSYQLSAISYQTERLSPAVECAYAAAERVTAEWALLCTAHNLTKLAAAT